MPKKVELSVEGIKSHPKLTDFHLFNVNPFELSFDDAVKHHFDSNDLDEFLRFCKISDIQTLFYFFGHYNIEDYYILEEEISELYGEEVLSLLVTDIEKHNAKIDKIDFDKPNSCYLYCIYQGHIVYVMIIDHWLGKKKIEPSYLKIHSMMMSQMDEISEFISTKEENVIEALDNLREEILLDPHFRYQTSKKKRYDYFLDYLENEADDIIEEVFFSPDGEPYEHDIRDFIEMLWRDKKTQQ